VLLLLQAAERSLDLYLSALDNRQEDYQPLSDIVQEPGMPYNMEYLSLLARRGRIDAYKEGRQWYTTKEAIEQYRRTRKRQR